VHSMLSRKSVTMHSDLETVRALKVGPTTQPLKALGVLSPRPRIIGMPAPPPRHRDVRRVSTMRSPSSASVLSVRCDADREHDVEDHSQRRPSSPTQCSVTAGSTETGAAYSFQVRMSCSSFSVNREESASRVGVGRECLKIRTFGRNPRTTSLETPTHVLSESDQDQSLDSRDLDHTAMSVDVTPALPNSVRDGDADTGNVDRHRHHHRHHAAELELSKSVELILRNEEDEKPGGFVLTLPHAVAIEEHESLDLGDDFCEFIGDDRQENELSYAFGLRVNLYDQDEHPFPGISPVDEVDEERSTPRAWRPHHDADARMSVTVCDSRHAV